MKQMISMQEFILTAQIEKRDVCCKRRHMSIRLTSFS